MSDSNETANSVVADIMRVVAGGDARAWSHALVTLEHVNVGVFLALRKLQGWPDTEMDAYHRTMIAAVRQRLSKST